MSLRKVLLTATVQSHICQFHKPLVEVLHEHGYEVHVAARDNLAEKNGLKLDFVEKVYNVPFSRSPLSTDNIRAYGSLKKILAAEHYEVVHCNTPMGGIVTRLAAIRSRKEGARVFYTAHGFHFYQGAPKKNWVVFYPIERLFSRLTDKLITITHEDFELAGKKFHCEVEHIHGVGVSSDRYYPIDEETRLERLKMEHLSGDEYVILCVGELNQNKNQKSLIAAAALLRDKIPNLKILLAGNGPLEEELRKQISELGVEGHIRLLGYRTDLENITPAVDLVVSCSHREGLPLNILEAMLCKKPVVASINRGHRELVENDFNGYKISADNVEQYASAILALHDDPELAEKMGTNGYRKAQAYTAESVKKELKRIYGLNDTENM